MRTLFSRGIVVGLVLLVVGFGIGKITENLYPLGLTSDPHPNPIGLFLLMLLLMAAGIVVLLVSTLALIVQAWRRRLLKSAGDRHTSERRLRS